MTSTNGVDNLLNEDKSLSLSSISCNGTAPDENETFSNPSSLFGNTNQGTEKAVVTYASSPPDDTDKKEQNYGDFGGGGNDMYIGNNTSIENTTMCAHDVPKKSFLQDVQYRVEQRKRPPKNATSMEPLPLTFENPDDLDNMMDFDIDNMMEDDNVNGGSSPTGVADDLVDVQSLLAQPEKNPADAIAEGFVYFDKSKLSPCKGDGYVFIEGEDTSDLTPSHVYAASHMTAFIGDIVVDKTKGDVQRAKNFANAWGGHKTTAVKTTCTGCFLEGVFFPVKKKKGNKTLPVKKKKGNKYEKTVIQLTSVKSFKRAITDTMPHIKGCPHAAKHGFSTTELNKHTGNCPNGAAAADQALVSILGKRFEVVDELVREKTML